ncbi:unnamed protein product, partial [Phaeothamnion confervicola]
LVWCEHSPFQYSSHKVGPAAALSVIPSFPMANLKYCFSAAHCTLHTQQPRLQVLQGVGLSSLHLFDLASSSNQRCGGFYQCNFTRSMSYNLTLTVFSLCFSSFAAKRHAQQDTRRSLVMASVAEQ